MFFIVIVIIGIITYHRIKYSYERNFGKNEKLFGNKGRFNFDTSMNNIQKEVNLKILDQEYDRIERILKRQIHYDYFEPVHVIHKGTLDNYTIQLDIRNELNPYLTVQVFNSNNSVIFISDPMKTLGQVNILTIYNTKYLLRIHRGL